MNLTEARQLFDSIRKDASRIRVRVHAYKDHPERGFTLDEILSLVATAKPYRLTLNRATSAWPGSFLFSCWDDLRREVKMSVSFRHEPKRREIILVINAMRDV